MIPITTDRLLIREATAADASFVVQLVNSPGWLQHIGDRHIHQEVDALRYIASLHQSYSKNGYGLYVVSLRNTPTPVGICGFVKRDYLSHPDLGFAVLPAYEGHGYVREAAEAILSYGQLSLALTTVLGITTSDNERSMQLLLRLGFHQSGTIKPVDREFVVFTRTLSDNASLHTFTAK